MNQKYYRKSLKDAQAAEPSEGHYIRCGLLASNIEQAIWQPWAKAEAAELAAGFRAEQERSRMLIFPDTDS